MFSDNIRFPLTQALAFVLSVGLWGHAGASVAAAGLRTVMSTPRPGATAAVFATYTVTTTDDSGPGSLRDAIEQANATPDDDVINFSVTGTITLSSALLILPSSGLSINGPGAHLLTVSGNNATRVFTTNGTGIPFSQQREVRLDGLTIANGSGVADGDGVFDCGGGISIVNTFSVATISNGIISGNRMNSMDGGGICVKGGNVTVMNSTLSGNRAHSSGGGISNRSGSVTVINSTLSDNLAGASGGGIHGNSLTIINSTFSGNTAGFIGGGINSNALTIINSTLSGNTARFGGGITTSGTVNITNSTISGNTADSNSDSSGGGIYNAGGAVNAKNTIIAGNSASNQGPDFFGSVNSLGYNLIGNAADSSGFGATGDLLNQNPLLGPLANNGGPTQTHALLNGSPAINAGGNALAVDGNNQPLTNDQRGAGFPRINNSTVDIGAFESLLNTAPTIYSTSVSRVAGNPASNSPIATVNDAEDAENTLSVTAAPQTGSGVSVTSISVSSSGIVTANVAAGCGALTSTFLLQVTDSGGLPQETTLTVDVTPESTPPTINPISNVVVSLPLNSTATARTVTFPLPTATDNCTANPTVTTNPVSGAVFPVGTTTVNVTAKDAANNQATSSFTVTVLYNFSGFFAPVDNAPTVNTVNAGQAIPVKFSLSGNKGLNIFAAGFPGSQPMTCGGGTTDDIEETVTAGGSSLSYDAGTDRYNYVWKTDKAWKGTCRKLVLKFNDGSTREALFRFR